MAKRQTRRSISVKGLTYQRLRNYCENNKLSVSGWLEGLIGERLDAAGVPVPERVDTPVRSKASSGPDDIISQHFTF